jgi:hypothetical protein
MLSDERATLALKALKGSIEAYRSAIALAAERIESHLATITDDPDHSREAVKLGDFAADRIDVERFSALWGQGAALDEFERALLGRARDLLREYQKVPEAKFVHDVPTGGRINLVLANSFAEFGRPFGATLTAELVRSGRYDAAEHGVLLHGLPRHRWNRAERAVAPPMVLTVDGADLWAGEAAQYLDGNQKIVLLVRTPAPPAALVRLITPGTMVVQTSNAETFTSALKHDGPVVVALMPEGAAEFVHLPDPSLPLHERLTITSPPQGPRKSLQSWSTWSQEQEWLQLQAMAAAPALPVAVGANGAGADPADRLAGWLLSQAHLTPKG